MVFLGFPGISCNFMHFRRFRGSEVKKPVAAFALEMLHLKKPVLDLRWLLFHRFIDFPITAIIIHRFIDAGGWLAGWLDGLVGLYGCGHAK